MINYNSVEYRCFSKSMLKSAKIHSDNAYEIEKSKKKMDKNIVGIVEELDYTSNVISSIIMAVAYLEAFINEVFEVHSIQLRERYTSSSISDLNKEERIKISDFWNDRNNKLKTLDKYTSFLSLIDREYISKGENPYQNVSIIIRLRNYFTHYKLEEIKYSAKERKRLEMSKLEYQLKGKFKLNEFLHNSAPFFPDKCISYGCTRWCLENVTDFTNQFAEIIGWEKYNSYGR